MSDEKKSLDATVLETDSPSEFELEARYIGIRKVTIGLPEQINVEYHDSVVSSLEDKHRPPVEVICQHCPGACFFTTHNSLSCFCKHMNTISWSYTAPFPITRCTAQGIFVAQWKAKQAEGG